MTSTLSDEERDDIVSTIETILGDYGDDYHDAQPPSESPSPRWNQEDPDFVSYYNRLGKLFYAFTGHDFTGSHGFISNWEGRKEED